MSRSGLGRAHVVVALLVALLAMIPGPWSLAAVAAGGDPAAGHGYDDNGSVKSRAESPAAAATHQTPAERPDVERAMRDAARLRPSLASSAPNTPPTFRGDSRRPSQIFDKSFHPFGED